MKRAFITIGRWLKKAFTRNLAIKVAALVFAFLLWGFVISDTNPPREKIFRDVPVTFVGTEDLKRKNLTPSESLSDILSTASVTVQANSQYLQSLTSDMLSVTVDLSSINEAGEHTLSVKAATTSSYSTVVDWQPKTVTLEIEEVVTRDVPVEVQYVGERKDWLYYGTPVLTSDTVEITGSHSNMQNVAKAVCYINIDDMELPTKESYPVVLVSNSGTEMDSDLFTGIPSVIVEVNIYPKKTVDVDAGAILATVTGVAEGYEITEITLDSPTVEIAGKLEDIGTISSVSLEPIALDDAAADTVVTAKVIVPEGVAAVIPSEVQVKFTIAQPEVTVTYNAMDVEYKNLGDGLSASLDPAAIDVSATGTQAATDALAAADIVPILDLSGLGVGEHSVEVKFENEPDLNVTLTPSVQTITVTIT